MNDESAVVRARLDRVVRDGASRQQAMTLWIDTDPADLGPEIRLTTGLNEGTDWSLRRVASWNTRGRTIECAHDVDIDWRRDRVTVRLSRDCLGVAGRLRVALKSAEWTPASGHRSDWWGGRRTFTPWVSQG